MCVKLSCVSLKLRYHVRLTWKYLVFAISHHMASFKQSGIHH
jgi:hypothetical protein